MPEDVSEEEMCKMEDIIKEVIVGIEESGEKNPGYIDVFFIPDKRRGAEKNLVIDVDKLCKVPEMTKETVRLITGRIVDSISKYLEEDSQIEVQIIRCVVEVSDLPNEMAWSATRTYHSSSKNPRRDEKKI